jgi:hypothetical protein
MALVEPLYGIRLTLCGTIFSLYIVCWMMLLLQLRVQLPDSNLYGFGNVKITQMTPNKNEQT